MGTARLLIVSQRALHRGVSAQGVSNQEGGMPGGVVWQTPPGQIPLSFQNPHILQV